MSQEVGQTELKAKTQQLLDGPLKHIRAAAIAAALLPLASVAATPASAQGMCPSAGVCGIVWDDLNGNGIQDAGEPGIEGASVSLYEGNNTTPIGTVDTGSNGVYYFEVPDGTYTVRVFTGGGVQGKQPSPANVGSNDTMDSDGVLEGMYIAATVTLVGDENSDTDFGFHTSVASNPGTGTPGYWKNHPEAWPVDVSGAPVTIMIGGVSYTKTAALAGLAKITKDKTTTMFSSLLSAKLNLLIGNDGSCLIGVTGDTIALADAWMTAPPIGYGPLGSGVAASSNAWKIGEPYHQTLDAYNNGLACAPHRQ